jgi:pimeloyl-ACP methyl ester carboxylesterase
MHVRTRSSTGKSHCRSDVHVRARLGQHNGFFWTPVVRELALLGHRSLAVDLPGHGLDVRIPLSYQAPQDLAAFTTAPSSIAEITVEDNVAHVVDVVQRVRRHGPVVLVGHSLGGVTIGLVANAIPDAVHRLVYLSAFCPTTAEAPSAMALAQTPEASQGIPSANPDHSPFLGLDATPPGIIRFNLRSADIEALEDFRTINMPEATLEQTLAVLNFGMRTRTALSPSSPIPGSMPRRGAGCPAATSASPGTTCYPPPWSRR